MVVGRGVVVVVVVVVAAAVLALSATSLLQPRGILNPGVKLTPSGWMCPSYNCRQSSSLLPVTHCTVSKQTKIVSRQDFILSLQKKLYIYIYLYIPCFIYVGE